MSKANDRNRQIVGLLHSLTQNNVTVKFTSDFNGMLTVSVEKEKFFGGGGIEAADHTHLGIPHGDLKELEIQLVRYLSEINNKVVDNP